MNWTSLLVVVTFAFAERCALQAILDTFTSSAFLFTFNTWSALDKPLRPLEWLSKLVSTCPQFSSIQIDLEKEYPSYLHHLLSSFLLVGPPSQRASEEHSNTKEHFKITLMMSLGRLRNSRLDVSRRHTIIEFAAKISINDGDKLITKGVSCSEKC